MDIVERARGFGTRRALIAPDGPWDYVRLLAASAQVAAGLLDGIADLAEARVAFLVAPSCAHVAAQWGIWRAGGVAVPLCTTHPAPELAYAIDDSDAAIIVADGRYAARLGPLARQRGRRFVSIEYLLERPPVPLPEVASERRAMILYTSGTTSRPKGVVTTHASLAAQIASVVEAWEWSADDRILHVLPLHHLHGILNILCCALWAGAVCELQDGFDVDAVWTRLAADPSLTLFMAVPTIYARLRSAWEATPEPRRAALSAGMTEIGMGLGNPLHGVRHPGHVGVPFPGVDVRLLDETGQPVDDGSPGAIEVRGGGVFQEYWGRAEETRAAFTADGWFRTGDVAVCERGSVRILGRASIDILKTGGFKVSALEIEEVLRTHAAIAECAVVGVADAEWGQRVGVAAILTPGATLAIDELRAWAKQHLAPYKVPTLLRVVEDLPRNPMGKVLKPAVTLLFA